MSGIIEDYAQSLKELTFPARPVINNLTVIAKEHTDVADQILNQIKLRINRSIPDHKLAPLYLLDSICKFVGPPYNILIGDEIFEIFSNAYLLVDEKVRASLSKLFETWKLTKSKGSTAPLFPREQMDKIERFLRQARSSGSGNNGVISGIGSSVALSAVSTAPSSVRSTPSATPVLPNRPLVGMGAMSNGSLITDIDSLIPIFQSKLRHNSNDKKIQDQFNALNQLRSILTSQTMEGEQLQQINSHIQNIMKQESISLKDSQPQAKSENAEKLFQNLVNLRLVVIDQSPIPGSVPKYILTFPKFKNESNNSRNSNIANALGQFMSNDINSDGKTFDSFKHNELTKLNVDSNNLQKFITSNKPTSSTISLLYAAKPSKCGTCGKRFSDNETGIQRRRLHLDWHFRVNKRLSGNSSAAGSKGGIVQSRNWYLDDYDWVKFKEENLLEYSTSTSYESDMRDSNTQSKAEENIPKEIPYVVIPTTETNMVNKCQICQDKINATYDDDSGEWRWVNCIKAPGESRNTRKIFHATCYNEANKKRGAQDDLREGGIKREKF